MSLGQDFMSLFEGRPDAVGTEEGGALRRPDDAMPWWWSVQIDKHLQGEAPCGVYPLVPDARPEMTTEWLVKWGCVDFDEGDTESWTHAWNVNEVLRQLGVASWVEKSRSKGYHVWVFLQDWMEARIVREALLGACQVVDAPTKEINPKSVGFDDPATLGNYVRLPYPGWLSEAERFPWPRNRRVMMHHDGTIMSLQEFVHAAGLQLASKAKMESLQGLYEPPRRHVPPPISTVPHGDIYKRMGGLAWTIFKDGPRDGLGRGHALFKLACLLVEGQAHTFDEIVTLCIEADERWGKFHTRATGEAQIERVVERAYGR